MLAYVAEHKPWIVVLENVLAAPFDLAKKQWFKPLGYTAWVGKLDTKDFYVPQTRRGWAGWTLRTFMPLRHGVGTWGEKCGASRKGADHRHSLC